VFNGGDVLYPKIAGVKVMASAGDAGQPIATLSKSDEMIFLGEEQDGWLQVESANGVGWVKKILVTK